MPSEEYFPYNFGYLSLSASYLTFRGHFFNTAITFIGIKIATYVDTYLFDLLKLKEKIKEGLKMKSQSKIKHSVLLFFVAAGLMVLSSCAVYNSAQQTSIPVDEIIRMSKEGVSSKDIIKQMRSTHSVYTLPANELAKLSREGVQDSVLNYMEKTHINLIRRQQQASDSYYWYPGMYGYYGYPYYGFGYGLGFGWPYYGYWGWGPSVIIHRSVPYHYSYRGSRQR